MITEDVLNNWMRLNERWKNTLMGYTEQCRVLAVNRNTNTCTVRIESRGIDKHSILLCARQTTASDKPIVKYPKIGSMVYVSFINNEYDGVVVNITELEQFLLQKGDNNISDAFEKIFEVLRAVITEVDNLNSQVSINRANLSNRLISISLMSSGGPVTGFLPARGSGMYNPPADFLRENNSRVDEAEEIKNDIFGEGTPQEEE